MELGMSYPTLLKCPSIRRQSYNPIKTLALENYIQGGVSCLSFLQQSFKIEKNI